MKYLQGIDFSQLTLAKKKEIMNLSGAVKWQAFLYSEMSDTVIDKFSNRKERRMEFLSK